MPPKPAPPPRRRKTSQPPRPDPATRADRQRDQRRVAKDRQAQQDLRRRLDQPDTLPARDDDDGPYRP